MDIKAPDLGVDSAEVSEIMVAVGDVIEKEDNIVLLESDKASVEVPSAAAGKITKINIAVGDQVSEGMILMEIDSDEDGTEKQAVTSHDTSTDVATDNTEDDSSLSTITPEHTKAHDNSHTESAATATYTLPDLGVEEAQVAEIMVNIGDTVSADESILLIESDKASVEVPAPVSGMVEQILVQAGDMVANGQDFIVITGNAPSAKAAAKDVTTSQSPKAETPKAETPVSKTIQPAPITAASAPVSDTASQVGTQLTEAQINDKMVDVYAGPAVRKLARQLGVDITQVSGSALNERILKEDLFAHVKESLSTQKSAPAIGNVASAGLPRLPDMSNVEIWGETVTQDLSRLQKVSIPQLNYNTLLPQVTQFDLSDITDTEKLRGELKGGMKAEGIGFTILAFVVKATAHALTQYPRFNSHLSDDNTQVILRKSINMGIAVATEEGLIVPVIKNVQDKGLKQIAIEIGALAAKARDKKLSTKELQGASFTISSQGNLGGTAFTPLVNWPQVGILGVSEASMQPRFDAKKQSFEPRLMLPLSLSYDHRVINGADAAVFTRYIATLLADPRRILL